MLTNKADPEKWVVGDILGYPTADHKFYTVCTIPFSVGLVWIKLIPYNEDGSHSVLSDNGLWTRVNDYKLGIREYSFASWLNKLAVIVQIDYAYVQALYKHDSKFYLIERKLM